MKLLKIITMMLVAALVGAASFGVEAGAISALATLVPRGLPAGVLQAGLIPEVWTKEFVKRFNFVDTGTFLDGITDYSARVRDGSIIHLIDFGCDPDVLVNNTAYPIPIQEMENADIVLTLDKLQTKATPVSDDTLFDVKAELIPSVMEAHRVKVAEWRLSKAIYNFAPAKNSDKTPVLATTGEADGTRKRFSRADVVRLKNLFDSQSVPAQGRRLVLCPEHVSDLLLSDQAFSNQYFNYATGAVNKMYGFEIYEFVKPPLYTAAGNKKAYGAAAAEGDTMASVAFQVSRVSKATGERRQYLSPAETDPLNQRNLYNVREYFLALPKKQEAIAAIYSGAVV